MKKLGLVAGEGILPVEFLQAVKKRDERIVVIAIKGISSPLIEEEEADKLYWLDVGQTAKLIFLLVRERVGRIALLGKFKKDIIYKKDEHGEEEKNILNRIKNKKDYSILRAITDRLGKVGIEVVNTTDYLSYLLPEKGVLGRIAPGRHLQEDIEFGYDIAKELAGMDIGQTIVVKDKTVVAVEAMEGTDPTIERGRKVAGDGCVMIKVSRPHQDMRWDIPTVGPETMKKLIENKFSGLAIESGRMYLLEKEKFLEMADSNRIAVQGL